MSGIVNPREERRRKRSLAAEAAADQVVVRMPAHGGTPAQNLRSKPGGSFHHKQEIEKSSKKSLRSKGSDGRGKGSKGRTKQICVVCSSSKCAEGVKFGAVACRGCKIFFRKSKDKPWSYQGKCEPACTIDRKTRNRCRACRFQICIEMGMQLPVSINKSRKKPISAREKVGRKIYCLRSSGSIEQFAGEAGPSNVNMEGKGDGGDGVAAGASGSTKVSQAASSGIAFVEGALGIECDEQAGEKGDNGSSTPVQYDTSDDDSDDESNATGSYATESSYQDSSGCFDEYEDLDSELEPEASELSQETCSEPPEQNIGLNGVNCDMNVLSIANSKIPDDEADSAAELSILRVLKKQKLFEEIEKLDISDLRPKRPAFLADDLAIKTVTKEIFLDFMQFVWTSPVFKALPLEVRISALQSCWTDLFALTYLQCDTQFPLNILFGHDILKSNQLPNATKPYRDLYSLVKSIRKLNLNDSQFAALKAVALFCPDRYTNSKCGAKLLSAVKYVHEVAKNEFRSRFLTSKNESSSLQEVWLLLDQIRIVNCNLMNETFLKNSEMKCEQIEAIISEKVRKVFDMDSQ